MASNKEDSKMFRPTPPPPLPPTVFPPLPPMPPPDANKSPAAAYQPRATASTASAQRRLLQSNVPTSATTVAQRYYHQYQYFPQHGIQRSQLPESAKEPTKAWSTTDEDRGHARILQTVPADTEEEEEEEKPSQAFTPKPSISAWGAAAKAGNSIWSVTPEELSELAVEVVAMQEQHAASRKLSYADVSKRGVRKNQLSHKQTPVFKKYFAFPHIPSAKLPDSESIDTATLKEQGQWAMAHLPPPPREDKSLEAPDYSRSSTLLASTPTFYPHKAPDANEIVQMLKSTLAQKKVAPHMDWWPGDWKCTNCGNHNFSYRDSCKRCRVGRFEDAGFVFSPSSLDSLT